MLTTIQKNLQKQPQHLGYNLEIKEANLGYTTVSTIDFNQLKHN